MTRGKEPCTVDDCETVQLSGGLCNKHYIRLRRTGTTDPRKSVRKKRACANSYVQIYKPDHPGSYANGRILEHRYVMELKLGRTLLPGETVHHINGIVNDNRPENLELWVVKQPKGQRPEDLVAWAKEILERYDSHGDG